jgi:hypothetical protein
MQKKQLEEAINHPPSVTPAEQGENNGWCGLNSSFQRRKLRLGRGFETVSNSV